MFDILATNNGVRKMPYSNFLVNIRDDVINGMRRLKKDTRVPMNVHCEQFLIDGLRQYGIDLPDYQPVVDEVDQKND
jgi:hypothetical protein